MQQAIANEYYIADVLDKSARLLSTLLYTMYTPFLSWTNNWQSKNKNAVHTCLRTQYCQQKRKFCHRYPTCLYWRDSVYLVRNNQGSSTSRRRCPLHFIDFTSHGGSAFYSNVANDSISLVFNHQGLNFYLRTVQMKWHKNEMSGWVLMSRTQF